MIIIAVTVTAKVSARIVSIEAAVFVATEFMLLVCILSVNFIFQCVASIRAGVGSCTGRTISIRYDPTVSITLMLLEWIVAGIITSAIRFRIWFLFVATIDFRIVCVQLLSPQFIPFLLVHLQMNAIKTKKLLGLGVNALQQFELCMHACAENLENRRPKQAGPN